VSARHRGFELRLKVAGFEPFYDIYQENDPEFSDKAQYAKK
jgi:hypothetical protein